MLVEGPAEEEVRGVGSTVAGAAPSTSRTASQVPTMSPQHPEWRSSGRSWRTGLRSQSLRNGGLTPSDPGAVEEWLAFNASVRWAGERKGHLSFC